MFHIVPDRFDLGFCLGLALLISAGGATAQSLTVLHQFTGVPRDGSMPTAGLIMDKHGNLFGTTLYGGKSYDCVQGTAGCGVVFKISPHDSEMLLSEFLHGKKDGAHPEGGVVSDKSGNLYGTTEYGGSGCGGFGCGTIFKLMPDGTDSVLHYFTNKGKDGLYPQAVPTLDKSGNLYGTTLQGGASNNGTVFRIAPDRTETILYSFCSVSGCADGKSPIAGLILDKAGNLYGTTSHGGDVSCDCGTVFKLAPDGTQTVLYSFLGGIDGAFVSAGLIMDDNGDFYGTTRNGGASANCTNGCGTVFELAADGTETVVHSFSGSDGAAPYASLIDDKAGNLYGTTSGGGTHNKGVMFKIASDDTFSLLYNFCGQANCADGAVPLSPLIADKKGNLYGTTSVGGGVNIQGTVFELTN